MSSHGLDSSDRSGFSPFPPLDKVLAGRKEMAGGGQRTGRYFTPVNQDGDVLISPDLFGDEIFDFSATVRGVHWSVAWSDLMMTMFIFFLVMFVYSMQEQGRPEREVLVVKEKEIVKLQDDRPLVLMYDFSKQLIDRNELEDFAEINLQEDRTLRLVLTGDLLFPSGKAALLPFARQSLKQIARLLTQTPYRITVVGHTDNQPIKSKEFPSNWELSAARAGAVARFLIDETHIPAKNFQVSGFASYRPVSSLDNEDGRARNRRVEIILSRADIVTEPVNLQASGRPAGGAL